MNDKLCEPKTLTSTVLLRHFTPTPLLLLSMVLMQLPCAIAEDRIRILTEQSFPISYTVNREDDGYVTGRGAALVREVMAEAKIEYDLAIVPWKRAIKTIDSGRNIMVFAMTRTPEREKKYHWVGQISSIRYVLFALKESGFENPVDIHELSQMRVGVIRGDVVAGYLQNLGFQNLVEVRSSERNLTMMKRGRIDLLPYSKKGFELYARRNGVDPIDFAPLIFLDDISTDMYMVFGLDTDPLLIEKVSEAYQRVKSSGRYKEIMARVYDSSKGG